MGEPTELSDDAVANGLVRLKETDKLFCCICSVAVIKPNAHIATPKHKIYEKRFNLAFLNNGKKVYCKKCNSEIEWEAIKDHAKKHKIIPWYSGNNLKPDSKTLFDNHTCKFRLDYYCFLCERMFDYWDTANSHFEDTDHQKRKKIAGPSVDLMDKIYTLLITQGFVPGQDMMIKCRMCDKIGLTSSDVRNHFQMTEHKENRAKFIADIIDREERRSFGTEFSYSDFLDTKESTSKLEQAGCSKEQSTEETIPERTKSPKKSGNVPQDQETGMIDYAKISAKEKPPKSPQKLPKPPHEDLSESYIVSSASNLCKVVIAGSDKNHKRKIAKQNKDQPKLYCLICYCEVSGNFAVKDHLNGKRHDKERKKYGCDNIVRLDKEHYCCQVCDCSITDFDNVYRHITSNTHLSSINEAQEDNHKCQNTLDEAEKSMEVEKASEPSVECFPCCTSAPKMEEYTKPSDVALANAIIHLKEPNTLFCCICSVFLRKLDKHILTSTHKIYLKRFNSAFVNDDEKVYCKTCKSEIEWQTIKDHGEMHKITPWYSGDVSKSKLKSFFYNHTVKYHCTYYCFLCERIFDYWDTANSHFKETDHQNRKQMVGQTIDSMDLNYSLLATQGFIPGQDMTVVCKMCDKIVLINDVKDHIKTKEHKENRAKFITDIINGEEKQNSDNEKSNSDTLNSKESTSTLVKAEPSKKNHNPINIRVPYNRSMICNFSLQQSTDDTIPERKESSKESGDVPQDQGTEKTNYAKISAEENPRTSLQKLQEPLHEDLSKSFIVSSASDIYKAAISSNGKNHKRKIGKQIKNLPDFYCLICYAEIPGHPSIKDHLNGRRHETALKNYGCDNIVPLDNEHSYCSACDCPVSGVENIYHHITSNTHLSSMSGARGENHESQNTLDEVEEWMIVEEASKPSSENLPYLYIVKRNAKKSFCQICDDTQYPVATKNINEHVTSQRHKIALKRYGCDNIVLKGNDTYYCKCCSIKLSNLESLYLHIKEKKHMSSLIKVCSKQEKQEGSRNRGRSRAKTPTLSENFNEPCQNFLSDYITKQIDTSVSSKVYEPSQSSMINNFTKKQDTPLYSSNTMPDTAEMNNQPELSMMMSAMATETSRLIANCNIDEMKRRTEERQCRIENKRIPVMETRVKKFYCSVCNAPTEDRTQLHAHMASHYTEEFNRFKGKKRNGTMNSCPANDRMAENENNSEEAQETLTNFSEQPELLVGEKMTNGVDNHLISNDLNSTTDSVVEIPVRLKHNKTPEEKMSSHKKMNMKSIAALLDFDDDYIYDLVDKFKEVELGMSLGLVVDSSQIYCLICRQVVNYTLDNYIEHLYSVNHCQYLEELERDNALFKDFEDQFSDLDLAQEYMQEISDDIVQCVICDENICNNSKSLEAHIYREIHERKCEETRAIARKHFEIIKPQMQCDWYSVQKYWCVVCLNNTESEVEFVKHLKSKKHAKFMKKPENAGKRMIFDFCASCALLWYGYRCTNFYHSDVESHKWLKRDGHYVSWELPSSAISLLASPEKFIDDKIKYLDEIYKIEHAKEIHLIRDLEDAVKVRFPRVRAYAYGSRVSGLGSPDSDIDIFLDCRNVYNGNDSTKSQILSFMTGVHLCLSKDPQSWDLEELLTNCRSPIIKACHRATGLSCDISCENGLAVENTKLIKTFNQVFPMCRKITLFLKQWLLYCDLSGTDRITNYALYWYVIFYLQKELIFPSVAMLIAMRRKSHLIAGWEVGVTHDFICNEGLSNFTVKEFLIRFFTFYANFDFRYDVACPLLGEVVKKRAFVDPRYLPKEMERYIAYMRKSGKMQPFRIDSPMCIQDPFDLQHNLTKAVSRVYLNRFRKCCAKSLDILWSK